MSRVAFPIAMLVLLGSSFSAVANPTTYTYDTLGRIATVTYPNGVVITYTYDPAGNRTTVVTATP